MSTVSISSILAGQPITITAATEYGGAISSITWNGVNYVRAESGGYGNGSNGMELQSAIHSWQYPNSWSGECYNPNEAGSYTDHGTSSSTQVLSMTSMGLELDTESNMAFYANPSSGSGDCSTPKNTTVLSGVILTKKVTLGFNSNIPQAIYYEVSFQIPTNYAYPEINSIEIIAWYLPNDTTPLFNTFLQYNPINGLSTDVTSNAEAAAQSGSGLQQANYPVILSYGDGSFAGGIYSQSVEASTNTYYYQYYYNNPTNKLGLVCYVNNLVPGNTYSFSGYLIVGTLNHVTSGLAALIAAYPLPAPIISYPASNYTYVINNPITAITPTNTGGPIASFSISPATLPNGLTFNSTTGVFSGTPTQLWPATAYTITAANSGATSAPVTVTINVVVAVAFSITNNSGNSISYTFMGIDGTSGSVGGTANAHSGTNPLVAVPSGMYNVIISPAGMPVNCTMIFNTGQEAVNTPGHTFTNINVSNSATTSLSVT
jgi:hypothetical protein